MNKNIERVSNKKVENEIVKVTENPERQGEKFHMNDSEEDNEEEEENDNAQKTKATKSKKNSEDSEEEENEDDVSSFDL